MSNDAPNPFRVFLPQRQDALVHTILQMRERLAPKDREFAELCDVMGSLQIQPWKDGPPRGFVMSKEPSAHEFIYRRHWELSKEIAALRSALAPKEKELADVQTAMEKLGIAGTVRVDDLPELGVTIEVVEAPATIKQMIVSELTHLFHNGASPAELRDYMSMTLGRDVDRNSISPQLARLREQGVVEQMTGADEGKWKLKVDVYQHPIERVLADEYAEAQERRKEP